MQLPLIEAAKNENYHTVVCDLNPLAPGILLADEFLPVSTKDRTSLLNAAIQKHIDGIVANSEYAMCDVSYIANQLHLIGNPEDAIAILSSKIRFRTLQKQTGLFSPAFLPDESLERLLTDKNLLSYPILIKPDQSSGTRGVTVILDPNHTGALKKAIQTARALSRNGKALAEEQIPNPPHALIEGEIFLHHGEILWDGLFHSLRSKELPMIPMTYAFPLQLEAPKLRALQEALTAAFRAAGILHGEYNIEMFFTENDEPFIIEMNPRQGGNDLPFYVRESTGVDLNCLLVTTAMGDDDYWNSLKTFRRTANLLTHHMLYPRKSGLFRGLQIAESLSDHILRTQLDIHVGDPVEKTTDGSSDIGYVDLTFSTPEDQLRMSEHLADWIQIV